MRGRTTEWHVCELPSALVPPAAADPRLPDPSPPLPYGEVPGGRHVPAVDGVVDPALAAGDHDLVITPWRGVLVPEAAA